MSFLNPCNTFANLQLHTFSPSEPTLLAHSLKLGQSLGASTKLRKEIRWSKAKKIIFQNYSFNLSEVWWLITLFWKSNCVKFASWFPNCRAYPQINRCNENILNMMRMEISHQTYDFVHFILFKLKWALTSAFLSGLLVLLWLFQLPISKVFEFCDFRWLSSFV